MGYPAKLTEEEQALVNKYAILKKKKRAQHSQKSQANESKEIIKVTAPRKETNSKEQVKPKDAKEAMEKAKKMLASGQLKLGKESGNRPFKRARSSTVDGKPKKAPVEVRQQTPQQVQKIDNIRRDSYNNFVHSNNEKDNDQQQASPRKHFDHNRRNGQRKLYITGYNLTRAILDKAFEGHSSKRSSYFDQDKGCGYVDFVTPEAAEKAMNDLHGSQVDGCILKVVYARRQPYHVDDNRYTKRHNNVRPDDPGRNNRRHSGDHFHQRRGPRRDSGQRSSDESPVKQDLAKKRKLVEYTEPEGDFDF